jgi:hypothetical protein
MYEYERSEPGVGARAQQLGYSTVVDVDEVFMYLW